MTWHRTVKTNLFKPALIGGLAIAVGFGGFGAWAAVAPLEGAVVASGTVVVVGRNKIVQHLEGGIVKKILVEEGQQVNAGDPVVLLDETAARSALNRLKGQLVRLIANEGRALAERSGASDLPEDLSRRLDVAEAAVVIEDQRAEFKARLARHQAEVAVLQQQVAALGEKITGYETQKTELIRQQTLISEEREVLENLLKKGLTDRSRVLAMRRSESELRARVGQLSAMVAESKLAVLETQERIARAVGARTEEASVRLAEIRRSQADLLEQIKAAQDVSERTAIRAPVTGLIIKLEAFNPGAVIAPGENIMEIVPVQSGLIVESRVRPQDIDEVRVGQPARLVFSAFDRATSPTVMGKVSSISADRLQDPRTGEAYYLARLDISPEHVAGFDPARIGPGQPVETFITTGKRTLLAYLTEPITQVFRRGLNES